MAFEQTLTEGTGLSFGLIFAISTVAIALIGFVLDLHRRAQNKSEARHEETRQWTEENFVRQKVYEANQRPMVEAIQRIDKRVEQLYEEKFRGRHGRQDPD